MTLSELSVNRPVLATVFAIVIVLLGTVGYFSLGVREYPSVDPPVVTVSTTYVGANAEIIENQITEPLEESINQVPGIKNLSSVSTDGRSTITVEFLTDIDLNNAANDVRDKVSQAIYSLPPDTEPPIVRKSDADSQYIFGVSIQSDKRDLLELTRIADKLFKERLETINGVSSVGIWGDKEYAMRIKLDPVRMRALRVTPLDVRNAVNQQNIELPTGRLEGSETELSVRTVGRLNTPEDFNNMVISDRGYTLVRLKDVGEAKLEPASRRSVLRGNGVIPMLGVVLQTQPGSNYIEIVDEAFKRIEQIKKDLPADIQLDVSWDTTTPIRKALKEVRETIFLAFGLVVLVIFFFLRNWRTTLIPVILIPISLIGSMAVLYAVGFSINILTLLGLVLATGLVVDDAIVVMENIYSKIEDGMNPVKAAMEGSREVFFAVIATSISLVCVFLPIFFLGGLTGRLFREFAMVVVGCIVISTFITLSLTPMMSSRMLKKSKQKLKIQQALGNFVKQLSRRYGYTLKRFMKNRWIAFPVVAVLAGGIYFLAQFIPSELAPLEDKARFRVVSTAPEGTSYDAMDAYQIKLMQLLDSLPERENLLGLTAPSYGSSTSANTSFVRVALTPPEERERSQMEIVADINARLRNYNFAQSFVIQEPTISASRGAGGSLPVQVVLQAPDFERLRDKIPEFLEKARQNPVFEVVTIDLKFNKPEYKIEINRDKALGMGISVADISQTLQTYLSEQRIGYFVKDGKQYYVIAEAEMKNRNEPMDLRNMSVRSNTGDMISLDNLVQMELVSRPPSLLRYNRYSSATVSASPAEGYSIADGIEEMESLADEVLGESFSTELAGSSSDFQESSADIVLVFIFALTLVYLTLAGQFESFRDPLTIMFTVPLALAGAMLSLYFFGHTLNIFSQIGMIVLIGIVTKNGILIVEFANQKRDAGMSRYYAAIEAAEQRFRPILMTSLSTVLGVLPIALALGESSTSRIPMGIAIIGGLLFSLLLTLYIIPAVYSYLASSTPRNLVEKQNA